MDFQNNNGTASKEEAANKTNTQNSAAKNNVPNAKANHGNRGGAKETPKNEPEKEEKPEGTIAPAGAEAANAETKPQAEEPQRRNPKPKSNSQRRKQAKG